MFYSFQDREHEVENNWRRCGDPKDDASMQEIYHQLIVAKNTARRANSSIDQVKHQLNVVNNTVKEACGEGWSEHQDPYAHYMDRAPCNMEESSVSMDRIKHQLNVVNDTIRQACGDGQLDTRPAHDAYNSGLANNSCFSWYNHWSMSQYDSRSTFFSETYDSPLSLQMSNDELICEDFMHKQRKQNEENLEKFNSLSSELETRITKLEKMLETKIIQETCSSYRSQDEQNDKVTLQSNEELESFSSLKEIANCYETDSDDDTQFETNEEHEKLKEPKVVAPPPIILPIFIPLRLTYIEKSNELELKDPPIVSNIDESEKKKDGGTPLKVEASDVKKEKITKIDLSSQLEKCLKNVDVMEGNKPQIKYHIPIERWKMTFKQESAKHVSRVFLKYFWVNYDAFNGRKVKIR